VDLSVLGPDDLDVLAEALEAGETVALGVVPSTDPDETPGDVALTERVLRWLDMLGLDPADVASRLVVSPACGLAGASNDWSRRALELARAVARNV
jgi:methionine synthase II (cobalamin-independent)